MKPEGDVPDLAAAVDALQPLIRQTRRNGLIWLAIILVVSVGIGVALGIKGGPETLSIMIPISVVIFGGVMTLVALNAVRQRFEALTMPLIAGTIGLTHRHGDAGYLKDLPPHLLPGAGAAVRDMVSGVVGGRDISFAEVSVTREDLVGKGRTTVFEGFVLSYPLVIDLPDFLLADERETTALPLMTPRINVGDLTWQRAMTSSDLRFGLWSRTSLEPVDKTLWPMTQAIFALPGLLAPTASLCSACVTSGRLYVAIRIKKDLFRIGGLFANRARLMEDVRVALQELNVPINLVNHLLSAEARLTAS